MNQRSGLRLVVLQVLVLSLIATLGGRLWFLQVHSGDTYEAAATSNRVRDVVTPATRGLIVDVAGRPLARNRTALVVSVSRTELLRQSDGGKALLTRLATVLDVEYADLKARTTVCGAPDAVRSVCWNGSPYQPIPVADGEDDAMMDAVQQILERREDFPGVTAEQQSVRDYAGGGVGANAAHAVGYLGPVTEEEVEQAKADGRPLQSSDLVGRAGLEKQYDAYLRGTPGIRQLAVDSQGGVTGTISETDPTPGNYVVTHLDAKVQKATEDALVAAVEGARTKGDPNKGGATFRADSASAVVMDVRTGGVVAMASYPSYRPNIWVGGISQSEYENITGAAGNYKILNRATQGEYAPGSIFKAVSTAAAVDAGFSVHRSYDCPGTYNVGNHLKKNYESAAYGVISFERAIEVSCDTNWYYFADTVWNRLGGYEQRSDARDPFVQAAKGYGLGKATGVDLPAEADGRIPGREWKRDYWEATKAAACVRAKKGYPEVEDRERAAFLLQLAKENCTDGWRYGPGDEANFAIGQGDVLVTPLQMARVYAAVANGGTLWVPQVAKAVMRPDGKVVKQFKPESAGKLPVSKDTLQFLQRALTKVSSTGTGAGVFRGWPLEQVPVASKTGTAEVFGKQSTSWFAAYAPADEPQYAIVMMVTQGGTGSGTSGPQVRAIYEKLLGVSGASVRPATALQKGAAPPKGLPRIAADGSVLPPATTSRTAVKPRRPARAPRPAPSPGAGR
ncbi:penicillin-binding protein 2 [Motilibacter aurantiacus]|uniref:penicillin-binding protein 2 n=1 Tax=Motilibacter aurantiacus TaxID=2714955 RepID=UPI001409E22F|nr:penicillin-binding protein 2 [Motilibacter aurantiacus]